MGKIASCSVAKKRQQRKKRARPQADESHQRKQERLEARRRAKEEALRAQARKQRRDRAVRIAVLAAAVAGVVWFTFLRGGSAPEAIAGHEILTFSTSGAREHTPPFEYETSPPVAGPHDPSPAACGTHGEPIEDRFFVHTLEHGAVAVLYRPDLDPADIETIEDIVGRYDDHTLSAPYPGMEDPIVVASWSRKMPLADVDEAAIERYIETFRTSAPAPEPTQECDNTEDESFEPVPSPTPSPGGNDTGGGGQEEEDGQ
jgi:hypothetical protein